MIINEELLEKFNEIWIKVSNSIERGFDSQPMRNEKYLKTKIKSYEGKININYHGDKTPKEGSHSISNFA